MDFTETEHEIWKSLNIDVVIEKNVFFEGVKGRWLYKSKV